MNSDNDDFDSKDKSDSGHRDGSHAFHEVSRVSYPRAVAFESIVQDLAFGNHPWNLPSTLHA